MAVRVEIDSSLDTLLEALDHGAPPVVAWRRYRAAHAEVLDYYEATFGGPTRPEAELAETVAAQVDVMRGRERTLDLHRLAPEVMRLLGVSETCGLQAVTFVGWERALAWCDDEAAVPRAYFALERMSDDPVLCRMLGAHELAHLAHFRVRPGTWPAWNVTQGIFSEAVAIAATQVLIPDLDLAQQVLLQPGAREAYAAARPGVHAELLELLDHGDEPTYRRVLFPPALCEGSVAGVNETGYAVAIALTEAWSARGVSPAQAARLTLAQARAEIADLLAA